MNAAHLHLVLNHVPLFLPLIGFFLLLDAVFRKSAESFRLSLLLFIFGALAALPAYFSGRSAEHLVEHLPAVLVPAIEEHEAAATWALFMLEALGAAAAVVLAIQARAGRAPRWAAPLLLALSVFAISSTVRTAQLGGMIHHPEARPGFIPPPDSAPQN